jgi:hypothetical protein
MVADSIANTILPLQGLFNAVIYSDGFNRGVKALRRHMTFDSTLTKFFESRFFRKDGGGGLSGITSKEKSTLGAHFETAIAVDSDVAKCDPSFEDLDDNAKSHISFDVRCVAIGKI